jgi:DNA-binding NtrC family response regulator
MSSNARSCSTALAPSVSMTSLTACARENGGIGQLRIELPDQGLSLETVERDLLLAALEKHDWNQTRVAAYLDITRSALLYRMQKFGMEKPKPEADERGALAIR